MAKKPLGNSKQDSNRLKKGPSRPRVRIPKMNKPFFQKKPESLAELLFRLLKENKSGEAAFKQVGRKIKSRFSQNSNQTRSKR
jgi:hypothetical protein